jgi:hypothetical protein
VTASAAASLPFLNNVFHFGICCQLQWQIVAAKVVLEVTIRVAEVMVRGQHLWQRQELQQQRYGRGSDNSGCYNLSSGNNDGSVGGANNYGSSGGGNG